MATAMKARRTIRGRVVRYAKVIDSWRPARVWPYEGFFGGRTVAVWKVTRSGRKRRLTDRYVPENIAADRWAAESVAIALSHAP